MCEYGFDDLAHTLMQQVLYFAKFYNYTVSILNLKKQNRLHQNKAPIAVLSGQGILIPL